MSRIVIMGNSMSMPRPWLEGDERITINDVYGEILRDKYTGQHEVDVAFVNSLDSQNAKDSFYPMVAFRQPNVVILHIGIIDCAPRLFRKGSRHLFLQPWFVKLTRDLGMRVMRKYRREVTKWRPIVYVRPEPFERNMIELTEKVRQYAPETRVYAVEIAEVADWLDERNYGYLRNIERYNEILRRVFGANVIEVNDLMPRDRFLISDGYHFSLDGHRAVAERIASRLENDGVA